QSPGEPGARSARSAAVRLFRQTSTDKLTPRAASRGCGRVLRARDLMSGGRGKLRTKGRAFRSDAADFPDVRSETRWERAGLLRVWGGPPRSRKTSRPAGPPHFAPPGVQKPTRPGAAVSPPVAREALRAAGSAHRRPVDHGRFLLGGSRVSGSWPE